MRKPPAPKRVGRIRQSRRGAALSVVASTVVIIGATVASAAGFTSQIAEDFDTKRETVETGIDQTTEAFDDGELNILVLGSDAREGEVAEDQRSDTMMLVHIPESRDEMFVMSIMRDLWVQIPNVGMSKINAAQSYGGYPLTIQTIEGLTGAEIDHMVVVDFDGFRDLTTALGGVEIDNNIAFSAGQVNPSYFPEGEIRLEGTAALRFVRERKAFIDGDYQRVKNQQKFLTGMAGSILDSSTLTNPTKISAMVNSFSPYLTVDEALDAQTLVNYGLSMSKLRPSAITSFTVPNAGTGSTDSGVSVVWPDEYGLSEMREAMSNGTMSQYVAELQAQLEDDRTAQEPEAVQTDQPTDETLDPAVGETEF